MMYGFDDRIAQFGGMGFFGVLGILTLWSIFWKGLALWKAARRGEHWWFLALLIINTMGILEILYLYVFTKGGPDLTHGNGHNHADRPAQKS